MLEQIAQEHKASSPQGIEGGNLLSGNSEVLVNPDVAETQRVIAQNTDWVIEKEPENNSNLDEIIFFLEETLERVTIIDLDKILLNLNRKKITAIASPLNRNRILCELDSKHTIVINSYWSLQVVENSDLETFFSKAISSFGSMNQNITWEWYDLEEWYEVLLEQAEENKETFDEIVNEIWLKNGRSVKNWGFKDKEKLISKAKNKFKGEIWKITDLLRSTILCQDVRDLKCAINELIRSEQVEEVLIKNRIWELQSDSLVKIRLKSWFVAEVQFHIPEIIEVKWENGYSYEEGDRFPYFTGEEKDLIPRMMKWEFGRILPEEYWFIPTSDEKVTANHWYNIRRCLPEEWKTDIMTSLYKKCQNAEALLYDIAKAKYRERIWEEFKDTTITSTKL